MKTKSKNMSRKKCSVCKGDVCIHEHGEKRTDTPQAIPDMAEQTMDLLEKLLKERENNPEEILQLASRSDLFQVGMDAFCLTAAVGHIEGMRRFLEAGKSPNDACAADGSTPLMLATQNRHVEAMEILLSYGADTTYLNTDGNTALILAIRTGDAKVVNTLWSYREQVDINHRNREGLTILHSAVEKRWETCVKIILSCGADVNSITDNGCTPLMLAAQRGDVKVAGVLIDGGADILIEDYSHFTAICHGFESGETGDEFADFLFCRMSQRQREAYAKNRIERMKTTVNDSNFDDFFTDSLVVVFKYLSLLEPGRDILFREKLIPNMLSTLQKFTRHQDVVRSACALIVSCMFRYNATIDERFARQFVQAKGPEFCLRALKYHTDSGKPDNDIMKSVFYPFVCINVCKLCHTWIEQNSQKIEPYVSLRDPTDLPSWQDEAQKEKGQLLWERFWNEFERLQINQRDVKMKELLDEEEREKERKVKKSERKKQKRLREKQKKAEKSSDGVIVEMEDKRSKDDSKLSTKGNSISDVVTDKDSGDYYGVHKKYKQTENPASEITGVHMHCVMMAEKSQKTQGNRCSDPIAAMNKSANSRERDKNRTKTKRIAKEKDSWQHNQDFGKDIVLHKDTSKICSNENYAEDKTGSWTKVTGKKTQQKVDQVKYSKNSTKKNLIKANTCATNVHRFNISESRKWSDVLCQRQQETAVKENIIRNTQVKESTVPIHTDDFIEFPSLRESLSRKWEGDDISESVKSESVEEHWDSDEYLTAMTNEHSEELPAWSEKIQNLSEAKSDVFWVETCEFERNVHKPMCENRTEDKQACSHPLTSGNDSGPSFRTNDMFFTQQTCLENKVVNGLEKQNQMRQGNETPKNKPNGTGQNISFKKSSIDIGISGLPSESAMGLVFLGTSETEPLHKETNILPLNEKQNSCPWFKAKGSAPTLKDVALEFMHNDATRKSVKVNSPNEDENNQDILNSQLKTPVICHTNQNNVSFQTLESINPTSETEQNIDYQFLQRSGFNENKDQKCHGFGSVQEFSPFHLTENQSLNVGNVANFPGKNVDTTRFNFPPLQEILQGPSKKAKQADGADVPVGQVSFGVANNCVIDDNCRKITLKELEAELMKNPTQDSELPTGQSNYSSETQIDTDEPYKTKVAVIQPIGHERKSRPKETTKTEPIATRYPPSHSFAGNPMRSFVEGLESTGLTMILNQNIESKKPFIPSPLTKDKCDENTVSGNCRLGDSILRNALNINHEQEEFGFPEELRDGKDEDMGLFPGFHDSEERQPDEPRLTLNRHKMELIQFMQLHNYYRQYSNYPAASHTNYVHDFQYYASAMGLSKQDIQNIIRDEVPKMEVPQMVTENFQNEDENQVTNQAVHGNLEQPKSTFDDSERLCVSKPPVIESPQKELHEEKKVKAKSETMVCAEISSKHKLTKTQLSTTVTNWTKKSSRWRSKLEEICKLPDRLRRRVGDIVLPTQTEKYKISYSDEGAVLGFLNDGSEVAVHIVDMRSRQLEKSFLQTLVSDHFVHFFLVRYKSFVIENGVCYLAMELHEYTLAEYIHMLRLNQGVDPLTVNRLTWQLLKGLTSLHENCGIPHGNIMPSNILVDTEGRIRLSEYGFTRDTCRQHQLMNNKPISEDRSCWTPTEVVTETEAYSLKSDIQVAGMLMCYIMSGGHHAYGENGLEITVSIQANWPKITHHQNKEIVCLVSDMLTMPPKDRPEFPAILKHPYFWADEKKLRFVLIAGSDVLRDMKHGVPTSGAVSGRVTMIDILNTAEHDNILSDWTSHVEHAIMKEMRSFRQYKNQLVELVLFVYNCCLHFDKLPAIAREIMEEPTKYFLSKFPTLFMSVYKAIKASERREKVCYKPFF